MSLSRHVDSEFKGENNLCRCGVGGSHVEVFHTEKLTAGDNTVVGKAERNIVPRTECYQVHDIELSTSSSPRTVGGDIRYLSVGKYSN